MDEPEKPRMELDRKVETGETVRLLAKIAALEKRIEALEAKDRLPQEA